MASRWHVRVGFVAVVLLLMLLLLHRTSRPPHPSRVSFDAPPPPPPANPVKANGKLDWEKVPHRYPVPFPRGLPSAPGATTPIPRIQARFPRETRAQGRVRARRLQAVLGNFTHAWRGYKEHAWLRDEVAPLSGTGQDPFGGWAATLVDSLGMFPTSPKRFGERG
jgi:mannosyl-oligosaccharide alpha-1,2-mannosidase